MSAKKTYGTQKTVIFIVLGAVIISSCVYYVYHNTQYLSSLKERIVSLQNEKDSNARALAEVERNLQELRDQDQLKRNNELQSEIDSIQNVYNKAVVSYEDLLEFKSIETNTKELDTLFASAIAKLSKRDYTGANQEIDTLNTKIKEESAKKIATVTIPANIPQTNSAPQSGYKRQQVATDFGNFMVSIIAADLATTKIVVDTASDSDCANNCPVLPLSSYVQRSNAYAGINGTYFCPASYPTCAGKTNSFDLLVMNKNKTYFNSSNNVYSSNPAVIFQNGSIRFVSSASQWGRDTGVDGVLSNYPLLVFNSSVSFDGDDDPKKGSKGNRSFIANKSTTAYMGVVHNATVAESARVLQTMQMENAVNLDSGGSTALWSGGYKVGPGRDIPNAVLFVRK